MNRRGEKPVTLEPTRTVAPEIGYINNVGHDDLTRFDRKKKQSSDGNRDKKKNFKR
jgi:hypothetical protein